MYSVWYKDLDVMGLNAKVIGFEKMFLHEGNNSKGFIEKQNWNCALKDVIGQVEFTQDEGVMV